MKLESNIVKIEENIIPIFEKMQKVANFEYLMPDNLQKFTVLSENSFAFALKGMPEIFLEKKDFTPHSKLVYGAIEGKMPFKLSILLKSIADNLTEIQFVFEADFNPMMALMIKTPVSKLIHTMAEKTNNLP